MHGTMNAQADKQKTSNKKHPKDFQEKQAKQEKSRLYQKHHHAFSQKERAKRPPFRARLTLFWERPCWSARYGER
jgi:uncharacterized protein (DUF1800 family)